MAIWAISLLAEAITTQPIHFDLAKLPKAEARCGVRADGEIVVCGARDQHRLHPIESDYAETPVRAEMGRGHGMRLTAHADQAQVGGYSSPRAMVTLSIPFGPGKKDP